MHLKIPNNIKWTLLIYLFFQLFLWVLGPTLLRHTIPHDVAEGIAWGNQWQWGYDKMPPLTAWCVALFNKLSHSPGWSVYLLAQCVIVITFLGVWRLALLYTTPALALLSVVALQGVLYYNNNSTNITPDTMSMPFWAWISVFYYLAVTRKKTSDWIILGLLTAGGFLTKYSLPLLIVPLFICSLISKESRSSYKTCGPYLSVIIALICLLPHLVWLYANNFISIKYVLFESTMHDFHQASSPLMSHFIFPATFFCGQLGSVIILFLLLCPLYFCEKEHRLYTNFQKSLLFTIAFGPFIATFIYSMLSGNHIIPRWGKPYFAFLGLWLIVYLSPKITPLKYKQIVVYSFTFGVIVWLGRMAYIYAGSHIKTIRSDFSFSASSITKHANQLWQTSYVNKPLTFIAGDHYLSAYVSAYHSENPIPYMDWDKNQSPWVNEKQLREKGAMFVWKITSESCVLPLKIQHRFPKAHVLECKVFNRDLHLKVHKRKQTTIKIGFAILPSTNQ